MKKDTYRYNREPEPYRLFRRKGIHFPAHFHPQIEVCFCISGFIRILADGYTYELNAGDMAFIFPNQRHYYYPPEKDSGTECYILLFYPSDSAEYYREWNFYKPKEPVIRKEQLPEQFLMIWDIFYDNYEKDTDYKIFKSYASLITAYGMKNLDLEVVEGGYDPEDIQSVLNYINQHFRENISLMNVAKELGFHPNRLSNFFNDKIGCSFSEHIRNLRTENARHLLKATRYSVNEIRVMSGFQSNRTFFRNFQDEFGMTPLEYRESMKKEEKEKL